LGVKETMYVKVSTDGFARCPVCGFMNTERGEHCKHYFKTKIDNSGRYMIFRTCKECADFEHFDKCLECLINDRRNGTEFSGFKAKQSITMPLVCETCNMAIQGCKPTKQCIESQQKADLLVLRHETCYYKTTCNTNECLLKCVLYQDWAERIQK
jgi:hypothetical protein